MSKNQKKENGAQLTKREVVDEVTEYIGSMIDQGALELPDNYSASNALKAAWLAIQEAKDKDDQPALQVCTRESLANALLHMVIQGLNPGKDQCYFVVYGNKLVCQRSYMGTMKNLLDAHPGAKISAATIYQGDKFEFRVDRGRKTVVEHKQTFDSLKNGKIAGAYCIIDFEDGSHHTEIMTLDQIQSAWRQGHMSGNSKAHKNFTDRMAEKTVINRACWRLINSSDDSYLTRVRSASLEAAGAEIDEEASSEENQTVIDVEPPEDTEETEESEEDHVDESEDKEQEPAAASGGPGF